MTTLLALALSNPIAILVWLLVTAVVAVAIYKILAILPINPGVKTAILWVLGAIALYLLADHLNLI